MSTKHHGPRSRPILVAVAPGDGYDAALDFAADRARREGCGVHLLHVLHDPVTGPEAYLVEFEDYRRRGEETLAEATARAREVAGDGAEVTGELLRGAVVPLLVDAADRARMVVLQRRDASRLARVLTGSVSSGVAAHARVPVAVVPPHATSGTGARAQVTVAVDVPDRAEDLLGVALAEARARQAALRVVHCWWLPGVYDDLVVQRVEHAEWTERATREVEQVLARSAAEYAGVPVEVEIVHGRPAEVLVEESRHTDLLVVGRHDPLIPVGSHLGPVARAVLRETACPVLLAEGARRRHGLRDARETASVG